MPRTSPLKLPPLLTMRLERESLLERPRLVAGFVLRNAPFIGAQIGDQAGNKENTYEKEKMTFHDIS